MAKVCRAVVGEGEACKEKGKRGLGGKKEQSDALCLHGNDSDSNMRHKTPPPHFLLSPKTNYGAKCLPGCVMGQKKWHVCALVHPLNLCPMQLQAVLVACGAHTVVLMPFAVVSRMSGPGWGHSGHKSVVHHAANGEPPSPPPPY